MSGRHGWESPSTQVEPIVDTHHHLWDLTAFRYGWLEGGGTEAETAELGDYSSICTDFLIDDLLADYRALRVVKSVHVQADISEDPVVETRWLQSIADTCGFPHAIVAYADLHDDAIGEQLDRHLEFPNLRGVRMDVLGEFDDRRLVRGLRALSARGLSYDLTASWEHMDAATRLARIVPELSIVLTHTGSPRATTAEYFETWRRAMNRLVEAENVTVKISGLGMNDHAWTVESIRPWVEATIATFGPERCMFGTNWPVDRLYSDMRALLGAYRAITSQYTPSERGQLLVHTAERTYRI